MAFHRIRITERCIGENIIEICSQTNVVKGRLKMDRDNKKLENERRIEHLEGLVERQTRTERHLEQYSDISSPENIEHAKEIQQRRQQEVENLKDIIVNGENTNNDQLENTEKRYKYTEGYINHNADHMDKTTLEEAKEKQEHRKEQIEFLK